MVILASGWPAFIAGKRARPQPARPPPRSRASSLRSPAVDFANSADLRARQSFTPTANCRRAGLVASNRLRLSALAESPYFAGPFRREAFRSSRGATIFHARALSDPHGPCGRVPWGSAGRVRRSRLGGAQVVKYAIVGAFFILLASAAVLGATVAHHGRAPRWLRPSLRPRPDSRAEQRHLRRARPMPPFEDRAPAGVATKLLSTSKPSPRAAPGQELCIASHGLRGDDFRARDASEVAGWLGIGRRGRRLHTHFCWDSRCSAGNGG